MRRFNADQLLPQGLGVSAARHHDMARADLHRASEGGERAGVLPQREQRLAIRPQRRQRLVIQGREPVVEQRRAALGEDRRDQLVVGNLPSEDGLAPHGRIERKRNRLANVRRGRQEHAAHPALEEGLAGLLSVR